MAAGTKHWSLVWALLLAVEAAQAAPGPGFEWMVAPAIELDPLGLTPLAAELTARTEVPCRLRVRLRERERCWDVEVPGLRRAHRVTLAGFHGDEPVTAEVQAESSSGQVRVETLQFHTPPLPDAFQGIQVLRYRPNQREPGFTLLVGRSTTTAEATNYALMLDEEGEVIWYFQDPSILPEDLQPLRSGNLLLTHGGGAAEIDLLGRTVEQWVPTGPAHPSPPPGATLVATDFFHHEFLELPEEEDADFLALSVEVRALPDYPTDVVDLSQTTPSADVVGDVIVEFRRDGTIVREWKLLDILDPYRLCYDSLGGFYNHVYGRPTFDWSHGNAVLLDRSDNTYVLSLRHQDAVVKIARETGELMWILGDHGRWQEPWSQLLLEPAGSPFEWSYHQHAPAYNAAGNLVLFDNGNHRAIPPAPPQAPLYSRAVEYAIDPAARTVAQVWAFGGGEEGWFSPFIGDADPQPRTGNVLVTDGARSEPNREFARIIEVSAGGSPRPVQEILLDGPGPRGWRVYRAERHAYCDGMPALALALTPQAVALHETLALELGGGRPDSPFLVEVVAVDGMPVRAIALLSRLDAGGHFAIDSVLTDPHLAGKTITLRALAIGPTGVIEQSCDVTLAVE